MHNSSITFLHYHYAGMNQQPLQQNKVLDKMRQAAMADFTKSLRNRELPGEDFSVWIDLDEIAKMCKGEGEVARYKFGLDAIKQVMGKVWQWGSWTNKEYAEQLKAYCSEEAYQNFLKLKKLERIGAALIKGGENPEEVEEWFAYCFEMGEIFWKDWLELDETRAGAR